MPSFFLQRNVTTNEVVVVVTNLTCNNDITIFVSENSRQSVSKIASVVRCIRESQNFSPRSVLQVLTVKRVDEDIHRHLECGTPGWEGGQKIVGDHQL